MSSGQREQILGDFMECTGLENLEECITVLDQHQWNLLTAVQAVHDRIGGGGEPPVPKHSATSASASSNRSGTSTTTKHTSVVKKPNPIGNNHKRQSDSDDHDDSGELRFIKSLPGSSRTSKGASGTATRPRPIRELCFTVEYKDQTERFTISDNENIHQLQLKIAEKLHVQPSRQKITNWASKRYDEHTILRDLTLPKENNLHLTATVGSTVTNGASRTSTTTTSNRTHRHPISPPKSTSGTASDDFPITVLYEERSNKSTPYELVLKADATIGDMKKEIQDVARLLISQQQWSGLIGVRDSDELRHTYVQPKSHLTVRKAESPSSSCIKRTLKREKSEDEAMDVDPEQFDDGFHHLSQHNPSITTTNNSTSNRELLIPDRCTNDTEGLEHFNRVFHARFGSTGPILYIGSLDQAIQGSTSAPRNERRPLVIYLHNDRSVCANVFCTQVLAGETIVEYLANNYVFWAWDMTSDANRSRLLENFKRCIGYQNTQRIAMMEKDTFPVLLVLIRARGSLEIISVIEGKSTPSEVLLSLIQAQDVFQQQLQRDAEEEITRETRENLKKQQEDEYHRSLEADIAKEKQREADEQKQKDEQKTHKQTQEKRLRAQQECLARLPEEPSETEKNTTRLKIRLPDNEGILLRRFRINDTLQILFDYLTSQGRMLGEYKLLSTYPKRDLTTLNRSETFEQLKLYPQEQLILEAL